MIIRILFAFPEERQKPSSLSEGKGHTQTWQKQKYHNPQTINASIKAAIFPPLGGIAFSQLHLEGEKATKESKSSLAQT